MLKIENIDTAKYDRVVRILEGLSRLSQRQPDRKSEGMYYGLLADCFRDVQRAREEKKLVVAHTIFIPTEFLFAMDIVPLYLEGFGEIMARMLGIEDAFATARSAGFASEICSGHRLLNAQVIQGWLPRPDAFVWSNQVCDVTAKTGDFLVAAYDRPGLYIDRPYRDTPEARDYFTGELQELIHFLEELSGKAMDPERLREAMEQTRQATLLYREICEMRKAVPSPMRNRHLIEMTLGQLLLSGSPKLVDFYRVIRDEMKVTMAQGTLDAGKERYRLFSFFFYPSYLWKLLDMLEKRFGAIVVAEPHLSQWSDAEIDPSQPLPSLVRKAFALTETGPLSAPVLDKLLQDARDYQIDGTLYWAHVGCRQTCATIRIIKDMLLREADIPTLAVDCDLADASYSNEELVVNQLEQFFELLDEQKS